MIATDLAQRYSQGESLSTLAREYHMDKRNIARTIRAMGGAMRPAGFDFSPAFLAAQRVGQIRAREARREPGKYCQRCEILLRFDPGQNGYCGECWEERR